MKCGDDLERKDTDAVESDGVESRGAKKAERSDAAKARSARGGKARAAPKARASCAEEGAERSGEPEKKARRDKKKATRRRTAPKKGSVDIGDNGVGVEGDGAGAADVDSGRSLDESAGKVAIAALGDAPADADALADWLRIRLGITIAREAIIEGHRAPFDYLVHAFFEGRTSWDGGGPAGPADCVVWASRGGGKTYLGAVATMLDLVFKPGIEVRILGGSLEQSRRMHAHLRTLFNRPALAPAVKGEITERRLKLWNGSTVELLAQSQASVRGTRVQKLRCDEVELFDEDVWEAAQLTTRSMRLEVAGFGTREVRGAVECFSTMHQSSGLMDRLVGEAGEGSRELFRWGVVDVLEKCGEQHACRVGDEAGIESRRLAGTEDIGRDGDCVLFKECRGRAKLKTCGHVTVSDASGMKHRVSRVTWESEMLSLRTRRSSAVYAEFDAHLHVVDEAPPAGVEVAQWAAGVDFGYRAPTVILWGAVDTSNVLWIAGEYSEGEKRLEEHVRAIGASGLPRPAWIGADPAGGQRHSQTGIADIDVLRKAGYRVLDRRFRLRDGIDLVRARLAPAEGGARLFIHRRCMWLTASLEKYRYDPRHPERDDPLKDGWDHAADALRYLVVNLDRPARTVRGSYTG